jgi:glutathione S-transferase
MPFEYASVEEAIERGGLRMVVVGGLPSPWSESAKGLLHIKRIEWTAVRLSYDSEPLKQWAGQRSGPVAIYNDERPRSGWAEILLLAERLAPEPPLLPADAAERAAMFGLAHEICGEAGLGWTRRLQMIHAGLQGHGGFAPRVAQYLSRKYGYTPEAGAAAGERVAQLLRMLAVRLHAQQAAGSGYYIGDRVSAVDVYSAAFIGMFRPLPPEHCPMDAASRQAFEFREPVSEAALDPILLAHRDRMYAEHLELPLSL